MKKTLIVISSLLAIILSSCATSSDQKQCYWQDNKSGKWVLAEKALKRNVSKAQCRALDSCNGGTGKGGGCYKWSDSAKDKAQSW